MAETEENLLAERVVAISRCFLKSSALQFLDIQDYEDNYAGAAVCPEDYVPVDELLGTDYRHRRVHVRIFGKTFS